MASTSTSLRTPGVAGAASRPVAAVLAGLHTGPAGLTPAEAAARLAACGPNAVRSHKASALGLLLRQVRSPILLLLIATALLSFFVGDTANATIIGIILVLSVGLGFFNEYRAERTAQSLHSRVSHTALVLRSGEPALVDVVDLVPGDVVELKLGSIVPADLRLLSVTDLQCDESILTGESMPVAKGVEPVPPGSALAELGSCALMGTVVHAGRGTGVVVATGGHAEFGRIALDLGDRQTETDFQVGLRRFSTLLLQVAVALTVLILAINLLLHRPPIESVLFALAIAVGITPQLLPVVVSTGLAAGSRLLARDNVLVKRLVCIEDLGNMDILVTDKTGTLTEGNISFLRAVPVLPSVSPERLQLYGLLATEADYAAGGAGPGQNPLDAALWEAPRSLDPAAYTQEDLLPFDHERRMASALLRGPDGLRLLVAKGAPEDLLRHCDAVPDGARELLDAEFAAGARVVAVAVRTMPDAGSGQLEPSDEWGLRLCGYLSFLDRPKAGAAASLRRLDELGITVKVATGDNAVVAEKVCRDLGMAAGRTLTGAEVEAMDDPTLVRAAHEATVFARVSPEQKARIVRSLRGEGHDVGFLGDGVNDAVALHKADVGISVDTATDVAKDAADIVLLQKDLGVLADGVTSGRRVFANTIKYVLMGTSSNFGNMFSAAAASAFLGFLPMLPGQILLNNLLYDTSQLAIPTDRVDTEQLRKPAHWDIGQIRRFMLFFGPISSLFDVATFAVMLLVLQATPGEFRAGWFVESLATQTLIVFAIRTRRVPFLRSRPSTALAAAVVAVVAVGSWLPVSPLAGVLGFEFLPREFYLILAVMVLLYLVLIEAAKSWFFAHEGPRVRQPRRPMAERRLHRRAARFSVPAPLAGRARRWARRARRRAGARKPRLF